jgi:hypothetical protein
VEWNGIEQMGSREWKGERERGTMEGREGVADGGGDEGMWGFVVNAFFLC